MPMMDPTEARDRAAQRRMEVAADGRGSRVQPHPDYQPGSGPQGDRCLCGGIRYWHAAPPHGCDDCDCTAFRPVATTTESRSAHAPESAP